MPVSVGRLGREVHALGRAAVPPRARAAPRRDGKGCGAPGAECAKLHE